MSSEKKRGFFRAFLDFFVLFSGVSTASNLARTQGRPLLRRDCSFSAADKPL